MKWAFRVSRLARQTSWATLASSRILPFFVRIFIPPLFGRFPEQCHVQQVCFAGVDQVDLLRCQLGRDQIRLDGVGVNSVVDFGQVAADVPAELLKFLLFEPLELLDQVQFELDGHP